MVLRQGDICLNDHTFDRTPAKQGEEDPSKLKIVLNRDHKDKKTGTRHRVEPATWVYFRKVAWKDKKSVLHLNQWRCQVFRRALGVQRGHRPKWTVAENDYLKNMIQGFLSQTGIDGRWGSLPWNAIARNFNHYFEDHVFPKGEPLAAVSDQVKVDRFGNSLRYYKHDTLFTKRSPAAMMAHLQKSECPQTRVMIDHAKQLDEHDRLLGYGGDEDATGSPHKKKPRTAKSGGGAGAKRTGAAATTITVKKTNNKSQAPALTATEDTPFFTSDNAVNVAKNARARQPKMSEAPIATSFAGTEPFPNVPSSAADLMSMNSFPQPASINSPPPSSPLPPPQRLFRLPKSTPSSPPPMFTTPTSSSPSDDTEDEDQMEVDLDGEEGLNLDKDQHAFWDFVRSVNTKKLSYLEQASSSPRPLSPFKDLDVGGKGKSA